MKVQIVRLTIATLAATVLAQAAWAQTAAGMVSRYKSMVSSFNSRNIVNIMQNYHLDFYNQGYEYDDAAAGFGVIFGQRYYKARIMSFTSTYTELALPYGYLEGYARIREYEGSTVINEETVEIAMYFAWQDRKWWFYGDQEAVDSALPKPTPTTWKDILLPNKKRNPFRL